MLHLEHNSIDAQSSPDRNTDPVLSARAFGYLLREVTNDAGRDYIVEEIMDCATNKAMRKLAQFYIILNFILVCESLSL